MKKLFLIVSFLFTSFIYCQDSNIISWDANKKLTWNDFQGESDSVTIGQAKTTYRIRISPEEVKLDEYGKMLNYKQMTATAEFYKKLSWSYAKFDTIVLQHEQLHFDIAELYARKIRHKFHENKLAKIADFDTYSNDYKRLWKECTMFQQNFDKETNHGRNFVQNKIWYQFVVNELQKLNHFD